MTAARPPGDTARLAWSIVLGLFLWILALAIAFGLAAGGDGWDDPFFCSVPLAFFYPLALSRVLSRRPHPKRVGLVLLAAGIALSLILLRDAMHEDQEGFQRVWRFVPAYGASWIALWLGWQCLVIGSLFRRSVPAAS